MVGLDPGMGVYVFKFIDGLNIRASASPLSPAWRFPSTTPGHQGGPTLNAAGRKRFPEAVVREMGRGMRLRARNNLPIYILGGREDAVRPGSRRMAHQGRRPHLRGLVLPFSSHLSQQPGPSPGPRQEPAHEALRRRIRSASAVCEEAQRRDTRLLRWQHPSHA